LAFPGVTGYALADCRIFGLVQRTIQILLRLAFRLRHATALPHFAVTEKLADFFLNLATGMFDLAARVVRHVFPPLDGFDGY
jgi:hypothetical protein